MIEPNFPEQAVEPSTLSQCLCIVNRRIEGKKRNEAVYESRSLFTVVTMCAYASQLASTTVVGHAQGSAAAALLKRITKKHPR
jgi:hypothetical protein